MAAHAIKKRTLVSKKRVWYEASRKKHSANLTRTSAYPRPCQQKMHFASKKRVWHEASSKSIAGTSQLLPLPAKAEKCERHHGETHVKVRTSISCETVASKTTFYAQGQQFEPTPRSTPGLNSYRKKHYFGKNCNVGPHLQHFKEPSY